MTRAPQWSVRTHTTEHKNQEKIEKKVKEKRRKNDGKKRRKKSTEQKEVKVKKIKKRKITKIDKRATDVWAGQLRCVDHNFNQRFILYIQQ